MRARPLVEIVVPTSRQDVLERFKADLLLPDAPCEGHVGTTELSLQVHQSERHVFSPWLSLELRPHDRGVLLYGRLGPHPHLWGLFVLLYASMVFLGIAGLMYGSVQWTLGETTTGMYAVLGATLVQAVFCSIDLVGRRIGAPQMLAIRRFVERVVPDGEPVAHSSDELGLEAATTT